MLEQSCNLMRRRSRTIEIDFLCGVRCSAHMMELCTLMDRNASFSVEVENENRFVLLSI